MNLDRYEYFRDKDFLVFEFFSEGPNGRIKKGLRFNPINVYDKTYFHISFGDFDDVSKTLDDLAKSNNGDRDKILATIASAVLDFTAAFPDMLVFAQGSTPARTRLYQMGIAANWEETQQYLIVFGYTGDDWEPFRKSVNYEAFFVIRKK